MTPLEALDRRLSALEHKVAMHGYESREMWDGGQSRRTQLDDLVQRVAALETWVATQR